MDVHSVFAASLPASHPSFAPQRHLDLSTTWQAPPVPDHPVELLIGILSAGNHFAERMAVRKSWIQHKLVQSSSVVVRFFVALVLRTISNGLVSDYYVLVSELNVSKCLLDLVLGQHARKEVNLELKKEAEFFGDIVIVPYMDNYDLVVLKTVAICDYGVSAGIIFNSYLCF